MKKLLYTICILINFTVVFARENTEQPFTKREVLLFLGNAENSMLKGNRSGRPFEASQYHMTAAAVNSWAKKYKYLELDTGISKAWYKKVYVILNYMAKCKEFLKTASLNKEEGTAEYERIRNNLYKSFRIFQKLLKNPIPVPRKRLKELRREKRRMQYYRRMKNSGRS